MAFLAIPKAEPSESAYNQIYMQALQQYQAAARALGIALSTMTIRTAADLADAFKAMRQSHVQAVVVFGNVFSYRNRAQISDMALRYKLPTMCEFGQWVQAVASNGLLPTI